MTHPQIEQRSSHHDVDHLFNYYTMMDVRPLWLGTAYRKSVTGLWGRVAGNERRVEWVTSGKLFAMLGWKSDSTNGYSE